MKRLFFILALILTMSNVATAQRADNYPPKDKTIKITHTNLPIVWVDVNGAMILKDERITAHMKIIHNGDGQLNYADTVAHPGQHVDYEGYIAIRYRGHSSFQHSRKPYSFRPLDKPLEEGGTKKKVDILGMGKDNNWALLAPYSDQSLLRNPLASSYTLGVSSGASLAAAAAIISGFTLPLLGGYTLVLCGFLGGLATVFVTIGLASRFDRNLENTTVILTGMVLSLFVNAILTLLTAFSREHLQQLVFWQMGSFSGQSWHNCAILLAVVVVGVLTLTRYGREMDLMTFGEEQALSAS